MRIFLSSTCYDLPDLRSRIAGYLGDHGHTPMLSDTPTFPVPLDRHRHDVCVELAGKVDLLILVIDRRYGAPYVHDPSISVTWAEMRSALRNNVPVRAFVRKSVFDERITWKNNPDKFKPAHCDNTDTFRLLDEIQKGEQGIWCQVFNNAEEVIDHLSAMPQVEDIPTVPNHTRLIAPPRILRHSPVTLFGRAKELDALDAAWATPNLNVYTLVAWGGAGKTTVVVHWIGQRFAAKGWPGVDRYFDWSFYSQGTGESRQTSSDLFIRDALTFFGDPEPTKGDPGQRGERLAGLVCQHRSLLVLDGIEPLQYPPGDPQAGLLRDEALKRLLEALAANNPGLCIVTTREHLANLKGMATAKEEQLDQLPRAAAFELLRHLGIVGTDDDLGAAWEAVGGHALTLQWLGRYVADAYLDRHIRHYHEVKFEQADRERQGRSAFKVMAAYERWLESGGLQPRRELAVLRLAGLFDRPMSHDCIRALLTGPSILGLTDPLVGLEETGRNIALRRLGDVDLLSVGPKVVDAHPLVREYFASRLRAKQPAAFREAHSRLFDYLRKAAPPTPDEAAGLADLYSALFHGCQAHRYEEAWDDVYMPRILRGERVCYATRELGLFGQDLAALAGFFDCPWDEPVGGLSEDRQALLFAMVGSRLRALGRLEQAVAPTQKAIDMCEQQRNLEWAAHKARHLAELQLARGELSLARKAADKGVLLADQSGSHYERYAERATLGAVLHHLGAPAGGAFEEADKIVPAANYKHLDRLYSLWGFRYCDFLLDQGRDQDAHERVKWMQRMTTEHHTQQDPENGLGPISAGLERLVVGRVGLHRLTSKLKVDETMIKEELDFAVKELRRAGRADFIPLGHISRAAFHRLLGNAAEAHTDLASAIEVIDRSDMKVHKADYFLELTRLELALGSRLKAKAAFEHARELIEMTGYGRRKEDLRSLGDELDMGMG